MFCARCHKILRDAASSLQREAAHELLLAQYKEHHIELGACQCDRIRLRTLVELAYYEGAEECRDSGEWCWDRSDACAALEHPPSQADLF